MKWRGERERVCVWCQESVMGVPGGVRCCEHGVRCCEVCVGAAECWRRLMWLHKSGQILAELGLISTWRVGSCASTRAHSDT
eukprot:3199759-Rhodomonas_salina.3